MNNKKTILIIILAIILLLGGIGYNYYANAPKLLSKAISNLEKINVKDDKISYITGKNPNNYLWYNGFMWRILAIDGNNNIHLIMEDALLNMDYSSLSKEKDLYIESSIRTFINNQFYDTLNNSKKEIINNDYTFCTTYRDTVELECLTNITDRVRLLSVAEYNLINNEKSYLNNGLSFWTINNNILQENKAIAINHKGLVTNNDISSSLGIRPVIVIKDNIKTSGDGSVKTPYILKKDIIKTKNNQLKDLTSGEYISYSNNLYRVVKNDELGTKVVLSPDNKKITNIKFDSEDNELMIDPNNMDNIGYYLKNKINIKNKFIINDILWDYGNIMPFGILNNYEFLSGATSKNDNSYWIVNINDLTSPYSMNKEGYLEKTSKFSERDILYSFYLKSNLTIKNGNGTINNPYIIE